MYFNDPKVKAAIHAPDVEWTECATRPVFVAPGDTSLPSSFEILPRVIAHGARTVVVAGLADFVLISEGWAPFLLQHFPMTHAICLTFLQNAHCDPKVSISFLFCAGDSNGGTFGVSMTCAYSLIVSVRIVLTLDHVAKGMASRASRAPPIPTHSSLMGLEPLGQCSRSAD